MHVGTMTVREDRALSRPLPAAAGVQGRLPPAFLLPLAAVLAASALLPTGPAWLVALAAIILLGVPHGALDGEVARPLLRPRFGPAWFAVFSLPYLSLSALVLLAWHLVPVATLAAFLAASVWHFGEEDTGPGLSIETLMRGGLPIAVPVLLHPAATAAVFAAVTRTAMPLPPLWLSVAAWTWLPLAAAGLVILLRRRRLAVLAEVAGLVAAFALLPPLTAFALYFIGFHAPRHMAGLVADGGRAPRVDSMRRAIVRSVPVTLLTLLIGVLLWRLYPGPAPERLLCLTLQGLAALTLPHLLLSHAALPHASAHAPAHDQVHDRA